MYLFTLPRIVFIVLFLIFNVVVSINVINKFTYWLNVFFYSAFSIAILWLIYRSVFETNLKDNIAGIIVCIFCIVYKYYRQYIIQKIVDKYNKFNSKN